MATAESAGFLQDLGLSPNEAKVYLALLSLGPSKITKIASRAGLHPKNAYEALERLSAKGLASHVVERNVKVFRTESPLKLRNILAEKTNELDAELPGLLAAFRTAEQPREVAVFRGFEGTKALFDTLAEQGRGGEVRSFAPHEMEFFVKEPVRKNVLALYNNLKRSGARFRLIHHDSEICRKRCRELDCNFKGTIVRRYTSEAKAGEVAFVTTGDVVFLNFFSGSETLYVRIKSAELAGMFRDAWKVLWNRAKP